MSAATTFRRCESSARYEGAARHVSNCLPPTHQREFEHSAIPEMSFVPFIVVATGRLGRTGAATIDFLQEGFGEQYVEYQVKTFVHRMSAAIAKMNGVCSSLARKLRIYRHVTELA